VGSSKRLLLPILAVGLLIPLPSFPASTEEIPPLVPPLPEIPPSLWERFGWTLWFIIPLLLVLLGLVIWVVLRPGKPPVLPAPAAQAGRALRALQAQPETGAVLSEISHVLRHYLINTFWLPPHEMTTRDFCVLLNAHEKIGPELAGDLASFLRAADDRKFAPATTQPPLGAAGRALELIELAEARRVSQVKSATAK
jgi:hypothetical protein